MNIQDLTQKISAESWQQLAQTGGHFTWNVLSALAIFVIGRWVSKRLVKLLRLAMQKSQIDPTLISFVCNVINIGLLILVIMTALGQLGVPTTSAAALLGGASLAIGLSLKDQLSNFAAGVLIILFRPFKVGDYIKVNTFEGYVREIKIVQTSLRTLANEEVVMPNSVIMSNSIVNKSSLPLWRAQVVVGVDADCDIAQAKAVVLQAALQHPKSVQEPKSASVQVTAISSAAAELTLWAWTNEADWWAFQCDLHEAVLENLKNANIKRA
ncbi:MAG: mechanosensitive ion channel family protein [Neisseria sp.]|nr:mechanosensitive ion channel family protein [Neisseria sp.]